MTKICAISDLHGELPNIEPCDLLLIAGDLCPATNHTVGYQQVWLESQFKEWLEHVDARAKVYIAGNHDFFFEKAPKKTIERTIAKIPAIYLQDSSTEFEGLNIFGTPWQPFFYDWAFNLYENDLKKKWELIPANTDIIIVHGPPHGLGDWAPRPKGGGEHTGSVSLLEKIKEIKPKLVVTGHIHEGYGLYSVGDTIVANCSVLNGQYELVNKPIVIDL